MQKHIPLTANWVVENVPVDIWRTIFDILITQLRAPDPDSDPTQAALILTHVCSSWRTIASNTPELWTDVDVCIVSEEEKGSSPGTDQPSLNLHTLCLVLRNARHVPLTMKLQSEPPLVPSQCDLKLIQCFLEEMHRAKDLTVDLGILDRLQLLDKSLFDDITAKAQPAPQLTKLSLRVADNVVPFPPILSTSWSPAPFLRSLLLNGAAGVVLDDVLGLKTSQFPFHQLTTLEIDTNVSTEAFFSLLSTTPSLQSGIFKKIEGEAPAEDSTATPICLPFLQVLQMGGDCWETEECPPLTDLLPFIKAPQLTTLKLQKDRRISVDAFETFIQNSSCELKHLHMDIEESHQVEKIECLKLLPCLESFDISTLSKSQRDRRDANYVREVLTTAMTEWDGAKREFVICPKLKKIKLDYGALANTDTTIFSDMVEARWERSGRSNEFEVEIERMGVLLIDKNGKSPNCDSETMRLLQLQESGLNLKHDLEFIWGAVILQ
ncbi:hypothetical protein CPB84DRAFT_1798063 [Gymnopilus junonius]|uniref:F-box domain-containing protein n=1 Tax=Gymnopilus junonius TaxID=109634 RepID=A0A9P5TFC6_GYMJU|nr:hypothetical protein CPB84DRAFT_1798063 [Gymnopilus junonius]